VERLSITNTKIYLYVNGVLSGGKMSKWRVDFFYYLDADNENEAWSKATLELPINTQITKLKREISVAYINKEWEK